MHQRQRLDVDVVYIEVVVLVLVALHTDGQETAVALVGGEIDVFGVPGVGAQSREGGYRLELSVGIGTVHNAYLDDVRIVFESESDLHGKMPHRVDVQVGKDGGKPACVVVVGVEIERIVVV